MREVLGSNPGRAYYFTPPLPPRDILWLSVGPCSDCEQQRDSPVSLVPARFRANSGMYLSRGKLLRVGRLAGMLAWYGRASGFESRPGYCVFLVCDIYSMTSYYVEVIEINTITQDLVPAYKKNHTGVGAKITQESLHVLSHCLLKYSDLFSNFNSENIKNVLADHGMSFGITCLVAWPQTAVHHLPQRLLYTLHHKRCK